MLMIRHREFFIEKFLLLSALITIFTTVGIILVLVIEAVKFFGEVSFIDFITGTEWTPLFTNKKYGILALLSGTFLTSFIAIAVALPIGLSIAIYLSEYAPKQFRSYTKPSLELLAAVPTVVYGFLL
jgi:phosphate transport system permease protein